MKWSLVILLTLFSIGASCSSPDPCNEGVDNYIGEVVVCETTEPAAAPRTRNAGLVLSKATASVDESGTTDTVTISLLDQPESSVYLGITSSDTGEASVSHSAMTFTTTNWNSPQTLTITGVDDSTQDGSQTANISIGIDETNTIETYYKSLDNKTITTTVTDDDVISFILNTTTASVTELGTTANFNIRLGVQPTSNVVIDLTASDTGEATVSPSSFTFTTSNWNTAQIATVTGVYDTLPSDGNIVSTITAAVNDGSSADEYDTLADQTVTVTTTDSGHSIGFTLSKTTATTSETGTTDTFTVVLTSIPTSNVVIDIADNDTTEAQRSPTSLTFTNGNWNTAQTVTITGQDDNIVDGSQTALLTLSVNDGSSFDDYDSLADQTVTVTNSDSGDSAGYVVSKTSATVTESGNTDNFTVVLTSEPIANVTFAVTPSDATEASVSPTSLTFTSGNWNTAQTVTITAVGDSVRDLTRWSDITVGSISSVDAAYASMSNTSLEVQTNDNGTGRLPDRYLAMGKNFTAAIDNATNKVYTWGDDTCVNSSNYGFCDYDLADDSTPSTKGSGPIIARTTDSSHVGDNSSTTPVDSRVTGVTSIVAGQYTACGIQTNRDNVTCWGRYRMNNHGLDSGSTIWSQSYSANTVYDIGVGFEHGCVLWNTGAVSCWGYGVFGAVGDGNSTYADPGSATGITDATDVTAGSNHSCALRSNGTVQCWGKDDLNQLGDADSGANAGVCNSSSTACSKTPVNVAGGITNFVKVDAGTNHTCGLLDNGTVYCWGANDENQLGDGTTTNRDTPTLVQNLTGVDDIAAADSRNCALTDNRTVIKCWGDNYLGDGSSTNSGTPVVVTKQSGLSATTRIDDMAGGSNVCVYVHPTKDIYCWGINQFGELGLGDTTLRTTMQKVGSPF